MDKNKEYNILVKVDKRCDWEEIESSVKGDELGYLLSNYKMAYPKEAQFKIEECGRMVGEAEICPNPKCGSNDLEYGSIEKVGNYIFCKVICKECKTEFSEDYHVEFVGKTVIIDGKNITINEYGKKI